MRAPASHRTTPETRRRGFSLIEVTIALAILAIGILAATAGQLMAIKMSHNSRLDSVALYLAEEQMEQFQSMPAADLIALGTNPIQDPANPIDPQPSDGVDMAFTRRWQVAPDSPEAGVITVTVEVDWTNSLGNVRTSRVQTLRADI